MRKALWFGFVVLVGLGALVAPARAQGVAQSFSELRLLIREGDTVTVTGVKGDAVRGRVESLTATSLVLARGGQLQTWSEADVVSIRQRRGDSLANGALIGFGVGAGTVLVGTLASGWEVDGFVAVGAGLYGGIGAGIGVGIDALITREYVIFERPRSARVDVHVAPMLARGFRGIGVSITF